MIQKMKIVFLSIFFLCFLNNSLFADSVDKKTIKKVAQNYCRKLTFDKEILNIVSEDENLDSEIYIVNFKGGGWVMISSTRNTIPVLGFSEAGEYKLEDEKPPAFDYLVNTYKEQVKKVKKLKKINKKTLYKWNELEQTNINISKSTPTYNPGSRLLNDPIRGQVQWAQSLNWDYYCNYIYNRYTPTEILVPCDCDHTKVGCGPVAMGQIMWYWKWPESSTYRTYDWNNMPHILDAFSSSTEEYQIAHLLKDCGTGCGMTDIANYFCGFSWTTVNSIENAFINHFSYEGVKKIVRNGWDDDAWNELIRSEIDNGRPVLYRGDKADISPDKHIWVIDGYETSDPDKFIMNFGHGRKQTSYNLTSHPLNNILMDGTPFNENQMAITGISPTYSNLPLSLIDIEDINLEQISQLKTVKADNSISLPSVNNALEIMNDGELRLSAKNSTKLKSGFHLHSGGKITVKCEPYINVTMDINIDSWPYAFTPNGDGVDDELCFSVENADSWEFEAYSSGGLPIFHSAGKMDYDHICVWDGTGATSNTSYICTVRFKNSYGREAENQYVVYVGHCTKSAKIADEKSSFLPINNMISNCNEQIKIYPNPANNVVTVSTKDDYIKEITIYNLLGTKVNNINLDQNKAEIKLNLDTGNYYVKIETNCNTYFDKLIINQNY